MSQRVMIWQGQGHDVLPQRPPCILCVVVLCQWWHLLSSEKLKVFFSCHSVKPWTSSYVLDLFSSVYSSVWCPADDMKLHSNFNSAHFFFSFWGLDEQNRVRLQWTVSKTRRTSFLSSSICEDQGEQPNIFQIEEQHSLQEVITEETLKSCTCSCYSVPCTMAPCQNTKVRAGSAESDSGLSSSWWTGSTPLHAHTLKRIPLGPVKSSWLHFM